MDITSNGREVINETYDICSRAVGCLCTGYSLLSVELRGCVDQAQHEEGTSWHSRLGYLVMKNQPLRRLVAIAYGFNEDQVSGGPKWTDSDRFDIEARAGGPAKDPELLLMLQPELCTRLTSLRG
jgi:uncharacterized protein (TIGR03435 family)